jgi:hypothetical protein
MAESQITTEANNVTPPLKNSTAMKCIAVLAFSPASLTQDLAQFFAKLDNGHFLTVRADGGKCYVAFGSSAGTIDETAVGTGPTVCWPLSDGESMHVRPVFGEERATGIATLVSNYNILHYKGPTGTATGYLRLYRSSLNQNQEAGLFRAP